MSGPLAPLLAHPSLQRFDRLVDEALEPLRARPRVGAVFRAASELGDWSLIWHLVGALRGLRSERHAAEALELSALLGVESLVVNQGLKRLFRRDRPTTAGDDRYPVRAPSTTSFPSGHASAAFFAAAVLSRSSPRLRPLWYALALVVASSRAVVRIHHGSDVVGGAAVGAAMGCGAVRALGNRALPAGR